MNRSNLLCWTVASLVVAIADAHAAPKPSEEANDESSAVVYATGVHVPDYQAEYDGKSIPELLRDADEKYGWRTRNYIAEALAVKGPEGFEALKRNCEHANWKVRRVCLYALQLMCGTEESDGKETGIAEDDREALQQQLLAFTPVLLKLAKEDPHHWVRLAAIQLVGCLGSDALTNEDVEKELLEVARNDQDWWIRKAAVSALWQIGEGKGAGWRGVMAAIQDPHGEVRGFGVDICNSLFRSGGRGRRKMDKNLVLSDAMKPLLIEALKDGLKTPAFDRLEDRGKLRSSMVILLKDDFKADIRDAAIATADHLKKEVHGISHTSTGDALKTIGGDYPELRKHLNDMLSDSELPHDVKGRIEDALKVLDAEEEKK